MRSDIANAYLSCGKLPLPAARLPCFDAFGTGIQKLGSGAGNRLAAKNEKAAIWEATSPSERITHKPDTEMQACLR